MHILNWDLPLRGELRHWGQALRDTETFCLFRLKLDDPIHPANTDSPHAMVRKKSTRLSTEHARD